MSFFNDSFFFLWQSLPFLAMNLFSVQLGFFTIVVAVVWVCVCVFCCVSCCFARVPFPMSLLLFTSCFLRVLNIFAAHVLPCNNLIVGFGSLKTTRSAFYPTHLTPLPPPTKHPSVVSQVNLNSDSCFCLTHMKLFFMFDFSVAH